MPRDEALAVPVFSPNVLVARFTLDGAVQVNKLYHWVVTSDARFATRTRQTYYFGGTFMISTFIVHGIMLSDWVITVRHFAHIGGSGLVQF